MVTADPFHLRQGARDSVAAEPPSSAPEQTSGAEDGAEEQASGAKEQTLAAAKPPSGAHPARVSLSRNPPRPSAPQLPAALPTPFLAVQGYLAHKKHPPP